MHPDIAGSAAVGALISQLRRKGWIGPGTASRLARSGDFRAAVLELEQQRAITTATARTLLRAAYGDAPSSVDGPETQGVERLHGTSADREAAGYDATPSSDTPLAPNRVPQPDSYDDVIARHLDRLDNT